MTVLLLVMQLLTMLALAGVVFWAYRRPATPSLTEEEEQAELYLTTTVERLLSDLEQSAQRASTDLAEQMQMLEALLQEADRTAEATKQTAPELTVVSSRPVSSRPVSSKPVSSKPVSPSLVSSRPESGLAEVPRIQDLEPPAWTDQVVALATSGLTPRTIARRLERGETEVRLVLQRQEALS